MRNTITMLELDEFVQNRQLSLDDYAKKISMPDMTQKDAHDFNEAHQNIFRLLSDGQEHSATEIIEVSGVRDGLRRLRDLRQMGYDVPLVRKVGRESFYKLKKEI